VQTDKLKALWPGTHKNLNEVLGQPNQKPSTLITEISQRLWFFLFIFGVFFEGAFILFFACV